MFSRKFEQAYKRIISQQNMTKLESQFIPQYFKFSEKQKYALTMVYLAGDANEYIDNYEIFNKHIKEVQQLLNEFYNSGYIMAMPQGILNDVVIPIILPIDIYNKFLQIGRIYTGYQGYTKLYQTYQQAKVQFQRVYKVGRKLSLMQLIKRFYVVYVAANKTMSAKIRQYFKQNFINAIGGSVQDNKLVTITVDSMYNDINDIDIFRKKLKNEYNITGKQADGGDQNSVWVLTGTKNDLKRVLRDYWHLDNGMRAEDILYDKDIQLLYS